MKTKFFASTFMIFVEWKLVKKATKFYTGIYLVWKLIFYDKKFIESACPLSEISTACIFSNKGKSFKEKINYEVVIGEAKTNADATKQLCTHKELGLASCLFEIFARQKKKNDFGLLKFDDDYVINFDAGPIQSINKTLLKNDEKFFENYVKFYLIGNLPLEKIKEKFVTSKKERESEQLIKRVMNTSFNDIVNFVEQGMK